MHSLVAWSIPVDYRDLAFVLVMTGGLLIGHAWTFHLVDPRGWDFVKMGRAALQPDQIVTCAVVGALAIALPIAILLGIGWMSSVPAPAGRSLGAAGMSLLVLAPAAFWEESRTAKTLS